MSRGNQTFIMKKIILLFMFLPLILCAQKQTQGNLPVELEFSPLGNNPLKISGLKARYFLSDSRALRMNLFLGGSRSNQKQVAENSNGDEILLDNITSNFDFSIKPGYEIHFAGTEKFSPYVGGEMLFAAKSNKIVAEVLDFSDDIEKSKSTTGAVTLGMNLLTGCDYYFTSKIFIGAELGLGFAYEPPSSTKTVFGNNTTRVRNNNSSFKWGPNYIASIRLGYCLF
jgi:hypothetical protein